MEGQAEGSGKYGEKGGMKNSAIDRWKEGTGRGGQGGTRSGKRGTQTKGPGAYCVFCSQHCLENFTIQMFLYQFLFCSSSHLTNIHLENNLMSYSSL